MAHKSVYSLDRNDPQSALALAVKLFKSGDLDASTVKVMARLQDDSKSFLVSLQKRIGDLP